MIDQFHELLHALGQQLNIPLQPDKRGACKLNYQDLFHIQMDYDSLQERILMASFICDMPTGKLRENIFRDALKAHFPHPEGGAFGYSERNNKFALFLYIPLEELRAEKLAGILTAFIDKARKWKEAIETGQTMMLVPMTPTSPTKPFGLKP